MSIIEIPIYETFPGYHALITKKNNDIDHCIATWNNCPTESIQSIYHFLNHQYFTNSYLSSFIDSLSHINNSPQTITRWKTFISNQIQKEKELLQSYSPNDTIDTKHIVNFLTKCGLHISTSHSSILQQLFSKLEKECTDDCLPYLCIVINTSEEIISSCVMYRHTFKQSITCSELCGNIDALFTLMLHQPEYSQQSIYCSVMYEDMHSNDQITLNLSTIFSYGFHLKSANPYLFLFLRQPHVFFPIDKQSITSILQSSFKVASSSFTTDIDTFMQYNKHQQLHSFFSILCYNLFKGEIISGQARIHMKVICHKFKSRQMNCTYMDLFLFLLHHPTYCSVLLYDLNTLFLIPPLVQHTSHIDESVRQLIKPNNNSGVICVNISCIGDIQSLTHYCIHSSLFSAGCSKIEANRFGFQSITLYPLRKLDAIHIDAMLHSYLHAQSIPEEKEGKISFFPHQLETIHTHSSLLFLHIYSIPSPTNTIIAMYNPKQDTTSEIVYYYTEHCIPTQDDIKQCIDLFLSGIMCIVMVTPVYYFIIQYRKERMSSSDAIHSLYTTLIQKYDISLKGKGKCQENIRVHFTNDWNQIEPFYVQSFTREEAKFSWMISVNLLSNISESVTKTVIQIQSEVPSVFSTMGPFYQVDAKKIHSYDESVYIYDDDNMEDVNEQIAETEYENALLFEQFNRYGIPEQEYEPEEKVDLNKEEYYDSVLKQESYALFLASQEEQDVNELEGVYIEQSSDTGNVQKEEKGVDMVQQVKEMLSSEDELSSAEDYLLYVTNKSIPSSASEEEELQLDMFTI